MPIRFRCASCDKLLGIARRKAGSVVNCPRCAEPLIVPTPEDDYDVEPADDLPDVEEVPEIRQPVKAGGGGTAKKPGGGLFERSDFEKLLHAEPTFRTDRGPDPVPVPGPRTFDEHPPPPKRPTSPPPVSRPTPAVALPPVEPPSGIYLSPGRATVVSVLIVALLAAAFGGGVMVGRLYKG